MDDIERAKDSETGRCLITPICHPIRKSRRSLRSVENWIAIRGARANNLKHVDVRFPVGRLSVITGISGSGKSTLMHDVFWPAVRDELEAKKRKGNGELFRLVSGAEEIEAVYEVDQSPIGKTSRSTPGTYIKVFDEIRGSVRAIAGFADAGLFGEPVFFQRRRRPLRDVQRAGRDQTGNEFSAERLVPCEDCGGQRYNPQTLEVLYNEKSHRRRDGDDD